MIGTLSLERFSSSLNLEQNFEFQLELNVEEIGVEASILPASNPNFTLSQTLTTFQLSPTTEMSFVEQTLQSDWGPTMTTQTMSASTSNDLFDASMEVTSTRLDWGKPDFVVETESMTVGLPDNLSPTFSATLQTTEMVVENTPQASWSEISQSFSIAGNGWEFTQENQLIEMNTGGVQTQSMTKSTELEIGNGWMSATRSESISLDFQSPPASPSLAPFQQTFTQTQTLDVAMGPANLRLETTQMESLTNMAQPTTFGQSLDFEQHSTNWSLSLV